MQNVGASGGNVWVNAKSKRSSSHHKWGYGSMSATRRPTIQHSGPLPRIRQTRGVLRDAVETMPGYLKMRLTREDIFLVPQPPDFPVFSTLNEYLTTVTANYMPMVAAPVVGQYSTIDGFIAGSPTNGNYNQDALTCAGYYGKMFCDGSAVSVTMVDFGTLDDTANTYTPQLDMDMSSIQVFSLVHNSPAPISLTYLPRTNPGLAKLSMYPLCNMSPPSSDKQPHVFASCKHSDVYAVGDFTQRDDFYNTFVSPTAVGQSFANRFRSPRASKYPAYWHVGVVWPSFIPNQIDPEGVYFCCTLKVVHTVDVVFFEPSFSAQFPQMFGTTSLPSLESMPDRVMEDHDPSQEDTDASLDIADRPLRTPVGPRSADRTAAVAAPRTVERTVAATKRLSLNSPLRK